MWVRKTIDIDTESLLAALRYCLLPKIGRSKSLDSLAYDPELLLCLSVRSGFDAFLGSVDWPIGSEIVFSGLTIKDMPKIALAHGYQVTPVDIAFDTLSPTLEGIRRAITPRTRAIVIAHLMGATNDLTEIIEFAHSRNILVIEDCAQSFVDPAGLTMPAVSAESDIAMFSFGTIKTMTALGGALFRVQNEQILDQIRSTMERWPIQSRMSYFQRCLKYIGIKVISRPKISHALVRLLSWMGKHHDAVFANMARGFAGAHFFDAIRKKPCLPLAQCLKRRLEKFEPTHLDARIKGGQLLDQHLRIGRQPGQKSPIRSHWIYPVFVQNPQELTQKLWEQGFDATQKSSLVSLFEPEQDSMVDRLLSRVVFLPSIERMPVDDLNRMIEIINSVARRAHFDDRGEVAAKNQLALKL